MTLRRANLPIINTLACSKAEIQRLCFENMNLPYLALNQSSVARLKQFVFRCQKYITTS